MPLEGNSRARKAPTLRALTDPSSSLQLFFVDVPDASTSLPAPSDSGSDSGSDSDESTTAPIASTSVLKSTNRRKAAWYDPADEELTVSLKDVARLRKLRVNPGEDIVGGLEYEGRLRRQCVRPLRAEEMGADWFLGSGSRRCTLRLLGLRMRGGRC